MWGRREGEGRKKIVPRVVVYSGSSLEKNQRNNEMQGKTKQERL